MSTPLHMKRLWNRMRTYLTKINKELCEQGRSSRVIRFNVERRVLVLETLRLASTERVQPDNLLLRRETGLFLEVLKDCVNKVGPSNDSNYVGRHVITQLRQRPDPHRIFNRDKIEQF